MKFKSAFLYFLLLLICFQLSSCASIISGSKQSVSFTSSPTGAAITIQPGDYHIIAPGTLELSRKNGPYRVTFDLVGFEPYSVTLKTSTNGWFWGNILLGGIIGVLIDTSTGAYIKLEPEELHAVLTKSGIEPQVLKNTIYLFFRESDSVFQLVLK